MRRRLLTISHSYVVALNRRLAAELARASGERWEVTAVAPSFFQGDLRKIALEMRESEPYALVPLDVRYSRSAHLFTYEWKLRSLLSRDWDLVHCWEEPYVLAGAEIALLAPVRTPIVVSTYQNIRKRYPPPFAQLERWTMARARGWIAGGATIADALAPRPGYAARPHRIIPMGVDVEAFRPAPARRVDTLQSLHWASHGPPVIGYLGRFVEEKGVSLLMDALDRVPIPFRVLFVGGGPLEGSLREWAAKRSDHVRVVTGVSHDGVPAYLAAMDLLCAPSLTLPRWKEQFGRMIVEAFACGVAVIGSDSGEIPHTVGDAGVIVPEGDVIAWSDAIERLVSDGSLRRSLAERGRERAEARYAWNVVARQTLDFFETLS